MSEGTATSPAGPSSSSASGDGSTTTSSSTNSAPVPKLQIAAFDREQGMTLSWGPPHSVNSEPSFASPEAVKAGKRFVYSPSGELFAWADLQNGVTIVDSEQGHVVRVLPLKMVVACLFSPQGKMILTWERPSGDGSSSGNVKVWNVATGAQLLSFFSRPEPGRANARHDWPLQWSEDERIAAYQSGANLFFLDGTNLEGAAKIATAHLPGLASFALAPGKLLPYKVATWVKGSKGQPSKVSVWKFPNFDQAEAIASKAFFNADQVSLLWNSLGTAVLVHTQTDVDESGQSYYGKHFLYFIKSDGSLECPVPLEKEGPIQDIQWSPTGREFIVVHGFMPHKAILFDVLFCNPRFDFGSAPRNTVIWSPHARFLCLAGFGNLQGGMDFWDRNKLKIIGSAQADTVVGYGWSPCSRYFMTATLFRRIKVDNGFLLWKYDGTKVTERKVKEMYEVAWRPALPDVFPNLPASPRAKGAAGADGAAAASSAPAPAPKKRQAYVPPHLRGKVKDGSTPAQAAGFTEAFRRPDDGPRKIAAAQPKSEDASRSFPLGYDAEIPSKSSIKNKKKRERKKAAKASQAAQAEFEGQLATLASQAKDGGDADKDEGGIPTSAEELAKRVKALKKKLRQIEKLKADQAEGKTLEKTQVDKVQSEPAVVANLATMEAALEAAGGAPPAES